MFRALCRDARGSGATYSRLLLRSFGNSKSRNFAVISSSFSSPNCRILQLQKPILNSRVLLSTQTEEAKPEEAKPEEVLHTIIADTEREKGPGDSKKFQAETRKLLDIVAHSLYSSKEVFLRELVSNGSDALEKMRHVQMTASEEEKAKMASAEQLPLEIHIATDEKHNTLIIQDTGIGMTKDELIQNLGVIAHSGSQKFVKEMSEKGAKASDAVRNMIGQFGVGFYSAFMVADRVDVYSQSYKPGSPAFKWTSDGSGSYDIFEAEGVKRGTKIVLHLKKECQEYAKETFISETIRKYSNFIGAPVFLNGKRSNVVQAIWLLHPREINEEMHQAFYRFIANSNDNPRYTFHFQSDSPLTVRALFYVSENKPNFYEMSRENDIAVSLYSRRVLILHNANSILPRWLRFMKGVVDCEDIPLNLSREMLQDGVIVRKLREMLTARAARFLLDQSRRDPKKYVQFYRDFGAFLKEGVITSQEQSLREDVAKLLLFESSALPRGEKTTLQEYVKRMKPDDKKIYYFAAPSRSLAESSPYFEAVKDRNVEVLFATDVHDDIVLLQLSLFDKKQLASIENDTGLEELAKPPEKAEEKMDKSGLPIIGAKKQAPKVSLNEADSQKLSDWLKTTLGPKKVANVKPTTRLSSHPCVVTVMEMSSARHLVRSLLADKTDEERVQVLQPTLEINPSHPVVRKLFEISSKDEKTAKLLAEQLYNNALIAAALVDDPRRLLANTNELLTALLEKYPVN